MSIVEHLRAYREAYAEDIFTPVAHGEKNDGTDRFTTRVSAHMGRFVLDNLIKDCSDGGVIGDELTKLRKRVEVLEGALNTLKNQSIGRAREKRINEALEESAKIAEGK